MSDRIGTLDVERDADGRPVFVTTDGTRLTADELAAQLERRDPGQSWWQTLFDVTAPAGLLMVGLGLLGQVLFTGRMIVQWLASEKHKRSTVPVAFWWMSLAGASLLLIYFIWRRDIVGVLGQGTGWAIYARNLTLIHRRPPQAAE
ncbi:MAG: lipid-A-disaccharide synthase N-terminal domain-containing protein [Planctomycetota bacterium]